MDVATLEHELQALPPEQQDRISAFLTGLRIRREGTMNEIERRLDDRTPENWKSWDEVRGEGG